jgi:hypothetical protein
MSTASSTSSQHKRRKKRADNWSLDQTQRLLDKIELDVDPKGFVRWGEVLKKYNLGLKTSRSMDELTTRFERLYGGNPPKEARHVEKAQYSAIVAAARQIYDKLQKDGGRKVIDDNAGNLDEEDDAADDDVGDVDANGDDDDDYDYISALTSNNPAVDAHPVFSSSMVIDNEDLDPADRGSESEQTHISATTSELRRLSSQKVTKQMLKDASQSVTDNTTNRRIKVDEAIANLAVEQKDATSILNRAIESQTITSGRISMQRIEQHERRLQLEQELAERRLQQERELEEKRIDAQLKQSQLHANQASQTTELMKELITSNQQQMKV